MTRRHKQAKHILTTEVSKRSHYRFLLDFILAQAEHDNRPYLDVTVLGYPFRGLLDSGSAATIVSTRGMEILLRLGLKLDRSRTTRCTVANGQSCESVGTIATPMCLMNRVKIINIRVVPELTSTLILGTDFWLAMDLVPNLKKGVWHFDTGDANTAICGIVEQKLLSDEQQFQLEKLLAEKFEKMGDKLGCTTAAEHEIELKPDAKPVKQRYYPVSPAKQKLLDEELQKMLSLGIVEPSKSAWSSPVLLVPKSDGEYRFCVDYRALNKVTAKDAYPLPYVNAILDRLRGARYLTSLDIKSAYWQVPVKENCREYTAFTIPSRGLFQFRRMPFGLTNAPATWQILIDNILGM